MTNPPPELKPRSGRPPSTAEPDSAGAAPTEATEDHVRFIMPTAFAAGAADVVLQRAGEPEVVLTNAFEYDAAWFSAAPNSGRFAGGNEVVVTHDMNGTVTNVLVGGTAVAPDSATTTNFVLTMPAASAPGPVNFQIQRAGAEDVTIANA